MSTFVDRVVLHASGGNGGHGCASVRREKFKPLGGPDGGDGGNGGDVILQVSEQVTTLLDHHHSPHQRGANGTPGMGDLKQGRNGADKILAVPDGTVVKDPSGELLADLTGFGTSFVIARGGRGGLGNAALASKRRKAPGFALLGEPGEEQSVVLELKTVADVALVGFPSAGKSSLIAAMSAARPKIADYPFTTLVPNLGVVSAGNERFTVADVPGLIPGASEGKGLGLDFLRHIERCTVIVHVLDTATFEIDRDPLSDLETIEAELAAYEGDLTAVAGYIPLMERPRVVVLNKTDIPEGADLAEIVRTEVAAKGWPVLEVSAVSHRGLKELAFLLARLVAGQRELLPSIDNERVILRPAPVRRGPVEVAVTRKRTSDGYLFQIRGEKPERWVKQTDFSNDEAVGFLADRLEKGGVEKQLMEAGAVAGDTVVIGPLEGGVIFDWEPTVSTGAEMLAPRGADPRLSEDLRPSRRERRIEYKERMDAKEAARQELRDERDRGIWTDFE